MIIHGETSKAFERRLREGWFYKYLNGTGIDIGCANDPVTPTCRRWDQSNGDPDATLMQGIPDNSFDWVYTSHLLEHLNEPVTAIQNWWRILKPGGLLIICVPHRDLYEKKLTLPSLWNPDHKTFWVPHLPEPPNTLGLLDSFLTTIPDHFQIQSLQTLDEGFFCPSPTKHSAGEYTIEIIVRKA